MARRHGSLLASTHTNPDWSWPYRLLVLLILLCVRVWYVKVGCQLAAIIKWPGDQCSNYRGWGKAGGTPQVLWLATLGFEKKIGLKGYWVTVKFRCARSVAYSVHCWI